MTPGESSRQQSLRYKVMTVFALTSLFPLLLFLLVLDRKGLLQDTDATLALGMSTMLTGLGFAFFLHTVRRINTLAVDFLRLGRGELLELDPRDTAEEFAEIARIVQASHNLMADLRHSAHELQNLVYKLTTLSEVTEVASRLPDIQDMLQTVLHRAMAAVQSDIGSLMLLEEQSQTLRMAASEGHDVAMIAHTAVRLGEGIAGKVAQTGEAVLVDNVERDPRFGKPNDPKYATASFICLPVRAHGRVIGVLNLSKKGERRGFSETDMKFLSTLLGYIGFAVDHARLVQEATTSAHQLQRVMHEKSARLSHPQQQLQHAAPSPASSSLLAQVGYALRGPLTAAMGHARLLVQKAETEGAIKTHQMARYVLADVRRATHTVRNLLAFAEPAALDPSPENLNEIVMKVLEVKAHNLAVGHIEVETDLAPALPPILGDAGQLHQAFLHMVNNARQAMAHQMTSRCLSVRTFQEGTALRVSIADTGPGIAPEHLPQIFTPFFSADTPGACLGLGLSIAHAIVTAHQGTIAVESHVGEGTTFMVDLPIATSFLPQKARAAVPDAEP